MNMQCSVDGCDKLVYVKMRLLCTTHYARWRAHGDPLLTKRSYYRIPDDGSGTRVCRLCNTRYPLSDFYKREGGRHRSECKFCKREHAAASGQLVLGDPVRSRTRRNGILVRKYGITADEYDEMYAAQGGVCYLCGKSVETKKLQIDHDHETNVLRKLLCIRCNTSIGWLEADIALDAVLAYLQLGKISSTASPAESCSSLPAA